MQNNLLQLAFKNIKCSQEGHEAEPLNYICISSDCDKLPTICYLCSLQSHNQHEKISLKVFLNKIILLQSNSEKVIPLCALVDKSFDNIKRSLYLNSNSFINFELIIQTFEQFQHINTSYAMEFYELTEKVVDLYSQNQDQQQILQKLNQFIKSYYFKYFASIQQNQWSNLDLSQNLLNKKIEELKSILGTIQQLKTTDKINNTNVLNLFPLGFELNKKIKIQFSEDLKPPSMTIISQTQAKVEKTGSERLIVLEPCLSKTASIKKWRVKIIKLASWIGVGVCHINQIKKANYMFNYTNTGHGNYLISSNGYSWSSYKKQFNSHFESFSFTTDDIIHVQYDPKERFVHFRKQSDPNYPTYKLEIEANDDPIYPQINMTGIGDEVEIINY